MLTQAIWCSSAVLETLVLIRGVRGRVILHYPVFYGYIFFVLAQSILRAVVLRWYGGAYRPVYWTTEFLALLIGSLVVFEVYQVALAPYPGTAKMARKILLFLLLMALAGAVNAFWSDPHILSDTTALQAERSLRTFQAVAILALVLLFASYSIPFGRNLRGILLGYGCFVGERVICLIFVPERGRDFWFYAYSASYITALVLWLGHLWSYQPSPQLESRPGFETEYHRIAAATQRRLREARGYLRKAARS